MDFSPIDKLLVVTQNMIYILVVDVVIRVLVKHFRIGLLHIFPHKYVKKNIPEHEAIPCGSHEFGFTP